MFSFLLEALQRLVAAIDRRRAAVLVGVSALLLGAGLAGVGARVPVIGPVVVALHDGLLRVSDLPAQGFRRLTGQGRRDRELADLRLEVARLSESAREADRLRAMLGYRPDPRYRTLPARIIRLDLDPLRGEAWINAGSGDGLLGGEAVVSPEGLVGVVVEIRANRSVVRLLRNRDAPVGVRGTRSRVVGVSEWDPAQGVHRVDFIPKQEDIAPGDTLVSSGLGGVFPGGLPVGTVTRVSETDEAPLLEVVMTPFAPFHRLDDVFVLLPWGPPAEAAPAAPSLSAPAWEDSFPAGGGETAAPR